MSFACGLIRKIRKELVAGSGFPLLFALMATSQLSQAATVTFDFSTDPKLDSRIASIDSNNSGLYQTADGNPDGFLSITESKNSLSTVVVFKDIDNGNVVKGFKLTADLRVGNSEGDRGADGYSISYARAGDPVIATGSGFAAGLPEAGTTTGVAIGFDTWSGNTLPDGADIEGIIVRVDNVTVLRKPLPTRHGACGDATSIQTGPRSNDGGHDTSKLCWAPLSVEMDGEGKLSVSWKGAVMLDKFQTTYFPSPGQLVLAGRCGGANEKTHVDNLVITTTVAPDTKPPTNPGNTRIDRAGSRSVRISWDPASDDSGLVAYNVLRDGAVIASRLNSLSYTDGSVKPSATYTYKIQAVDVAANTSPGFSNEVTATTVEDVDSPGFVFAEIYDNIAGSSVGNLLGSPKWASRAYDRGVVLAGITFGEPAFGNTYGENYALVMSGTITAPETASYDFFVRSDQASQFYLNPGGAAIPPADGGGYIAEETGCCNPFQEPGAVQTTKSPIPLTAGQQYGFIFLVKEGGGGDWGQVAMRKAGDTTPAETLGPIRGLVTGRVDPGGASVTIQSNPSDVTAPENSTVSFQVFARGDSPQASGILVYQWYRNGNPILGANSASYSIPLVRQSDHGARFKCQASVAGRSAMSFEATLTVNSDTVPPTITKVSASDDFTHVAIFFSEPLDRTSAETPGNYDIAGLSVLAARLEGLSKVVLTTSRQAEFASYLLKVNNVKDTGVPANAVAPNSSSGFMSFRFMPGLAKWEYFGNITGFSVADLEASGKFKNSQPDEVLQVAGFEGPTSYADSYGARLTALLTPQTSGNYVFYISSDSQSSLRLSTDEDPAHKVQIATEPDWNGVRDWTGTSRRNPTSPENRSAPIALVKGKRYYLEMLHKEDGGGDNAAATFVLQGNSPSSIPISGADLGWFVDPGIGAPKILSQPSGQTLGKGGSVTLSTDAIGAQPISWQWSVNGYPIPGATGRTYTINGMDLSKVGYYVATASNAEGLVSTSNALVDMMPDDTLPTGSFIIEVEDFNYGGGLHKAEADAAGYAGGAYAGLSAVQDVDYHETGGNQNVAYRSASQNSAMTGNSDNDRGLFEVTTGYKMGWNDPGDWWNYTRNFGAAKSYNIVGRFSSVGSTIGVGIGVVSGATSTGQTVTSVGSFKSPASGGWDTMVFVPLRDPSGELASITLGGEATLRLSVLMGSNEEMNYFALVPALPSASRISFSSIPDKVLGDAPFGLKASCDSGLPVSFTVVAGPATILGNVVTLNGAGTVTVRATQPGDGTHAAAMPVDRSFTVMPAPKSSQTISFGVLVDKSIGDAPFPLVATADSGLPVSFSIVSGPATITGNLITLTGTGTVVVRAAQPGDATRNAALPIDRAFQVRAVPKKAQAISFTSIPDKALGDAPFALSATASSGLPVTFAVLSGPATLSGNLLSVTGMGVVVVRATQAGNDQFDPAPAEDRSFVVSENHAPIMAAVADQVVLGTNVLELAVVISDVETPEGPFTVSAISLNPELIAPEALILTGEGGSRQLTFSAREGKFGTGRIRVAAADSRGATGSIEFNVIVKRPITFKPLADQNVDLNTVVGPMLVEILDRGDLAAGLTWSAVSSDQELFPAGQILTAPQGSSCSLVLVPSADRGGVATITVRVGDGVLTAETQLVVTVRRPNQMPQIGPVADRTVTAGRAIALTFTVGDAETLAEKLVVKVVSGRSDLISPSNITLFGTGATRSLELVATAGRAGDCPITITVQDEAGAVVNRTIMVTVVPNGLPRISEIPDQKLVIPGGLVVPFSVGDAETPSENLKVGVTTGNTELLKESDLQLSGVGGDRMLAISAAAGRLGNCRITILVEDDLGGVSTRVFNVGLAAPAPVITLVPPSHGASYEEGENLVLEVRVVAEQGEVASVEFFDGDTLLSKLTTAASSYQLSSSSLALGSHTIRVRAVDGAGEETRTNVFTATIVPRKQPNDAFAQRIALELESIAASTLAATREAGEPLHAGTGSGPSLWYTWSSPVEGTVRLTTVGSDFDTVLAVYTGTELGQLVEVASNDNAPGGGPHSEVTFAARAGVAYAIAVAGGGETAGLAKLSWGFVAVQGSVLQIRTTTEALTLTWPVGLPGAVLEFSEGLSGEGGWKTVDVSNTVVGGVYTFKVPMTGGSGFYRIRVVQ